MNLDLTGFIKQGLHILWKVIEFPFLIWNKVPKSIRWSIFIIIGLIALMLLIDAIKKRNAWRHYYVQ